MSKKTTRGSVIAEWRKGADLVDDNVFDEGQAFNGASRPISEVAVLLANPDLPTIKRVDPEKERSNLVIVRSIRNWSHAGRLAAQHFCSPRPHRIEDATQVTAGSVLRSLTHNHVLIMLEPKQELPSVLEKLSHAIIDCDRLTNEHLQTAVRMRFNEPRFTWPAQWSILDWDSQHLDAAADRARTGAEFIEILQAMDGEDVSQEEVDAALDLLAEEADVAEVTEGPTARVLTSPPAKTTDATKRMWQVCTKIADVDLPLRTALIDPTAELIEAWPHAAEVVCRLLANVHRGEVVKLRPTILIGAPGTGKTSLLQAIASRLDVPHIVFPCATSGDNSFGGTPARWHTAQISTPGEAIRQHQIANPVVILDELEKAGRHYENGSLTDALLPMLEAHTAKTYYDAALDAPFDLSHVSFVATANSLTIPAPLKDRFDVVKMPDPGPEHIGPLAKRIVDNIRRLRGLQEGMLPPLAPDEEELIRQVWNSGSLRRLTRIVEALVDNRDRMQAQH